MITGPEKCNRYHANVQLFMFFLGWRYRFFLFALGATYLCLAGALVGVISGGRVPGLVGIVGLILGAVVSAAALAFEARFRHFVNLAGQFVRRHDDESDSAAEIVNRTYFQAYIETPGALTQTIVVRAVLGVHIAACVGLAVALFMSR